MSTPLPAEEAAKLLQDASQDWQAFWFNHGAVAKNLRELSVSLEAMTDEQFEHHVNATKNDVADWLEAVIGDAQLAAKLRLLRTLAGTQAMVSRRVVELDARCAPEAPAKEEAPVATIAVAAVMPAPAAVTAPAHVKTAKRSKKPVATRKPARAAKKEKEKATTKAAAKGSVWTKLLKR